ncbi:hypothetical protein K1T71_001274 [Dendrolimus kikuchii]|uniref:Uncharacterized protein n=1 Tax=Dendrolimus kikuchii TaxID=765133 RepID=A0ACC1DI16_9NEOP|nr:hypothetical protein K1T71_001274 [Dendrolimus kikuchii]
MIWKTLHANTSDDWEPPELRRLKYQLANLTCKCNTCTWNSPSKENHCEKEVQAERKVNSIDRFIQAARIPIYPENLQYPAKEFCPSCFITLNLLRGGLTKFMKDEESETKREMFTRDKGTRKIVKYAEKTTSFTGRPTPVYSNVTFCDFISECSSEISEVGKYKNNGQERVRFLSPIENEANQPLMSIYGECFCLDKFIDSIRPPLIDIQ